MTGLIENYIRRIEKLLSNRATVPLTGTNHVDDLWLSSDIYPGELSVNLSKGSLYTSDGKSIIDLNKENVILSGLVLSKSTSGVNKLTVSSGIIRYNGISYYHISSGTDILLAPNITANPQLLFIYGVTTNGVYGNSSNGNLVLGLTYTSIYGSVDENGIFQSVSLYDNVPFAPANSILLGTAILYPGEFGYDIWPVSVASLGDYYPKFSLTPSELLRTIVKTVGKFEFHSLYFPGQFIIDHDSSTAYVAKKIFVSDYLDISNDIADGNIIPIGASGSGGSGGDTAISLLGGSDVYKTKVGSQFQFRSLTASGPITITTNANTLAIGLSMSGFVTGLTNIGTGEFIYNGLTSTIAKLKSITGGTNVSVSTNGDSIVINVPQIGSTAQGINLGPTSSADVYAGMTGADLTFRRLSFGAGISASQSANLITIDAVGKDNNGVSIGNGTAIYTGMSGNNLKIRSLTGGGSVTVTSLGDTITISSTGGGVGSTGLNVGATGTTSGRIYRGMSGSSQLKFGSITSGYGIAIAEDGDNVQITSTITNGPQGSQGFKGPQGSTGTRGFQGFQGRQGPSGANGRNGTDGTIGTDGNQGWQGPQGSGPQGATGDRGPTGISAAITPRRFLDIYDSSGGGTVSASNYRYLNFNTDSPRSNTDPVLYTFGSITQVPPDGTYIQLNEGGDYLFLYTISLLLPSNGVFVGYLWDYTLGESGSKVDGSDIYFKAMGGSETVTSSGTVSLTGISSGNRYAIRLEASFGANGVASTLVNGSSIYIEKLEIGAGTEGPAGPQGTGTQGPQGAPGIASTSVKSPLVGAGTEIDPFTLAYSNDFVLSTTDITPGGATGISLNLESKAIVIPKISSAWNIYKSNGSTPLATVSISSNTGVAGSVGPTSSSNSITVPTGAKVSYSGTAFIPAPGATQGPPTGVTGSFIFTPTVPTVFGATSATFVSPSQLTTGTTYRIDITKLKTGLSVLNNQVVRATGYDASNATTSVTFSDIFYYGYLQIGPTGGHIPPSTVNAITPTQIQGLGNLRFGGRTQSSLTVNDSSGAGRGPGWRFVFSYPANLGLIGIGDVNITGVSVPVGGAFVKGATSVTTPSGDTYSYNIYISDQDNSYPGKNFTIT